MSGGLAGEHAGRVRPSGRHVRRLSAFQRVGDDVADIGRQLHVRRLEHLTEAVIQVPHCTAEQLTKRNASTCA
jgi:hypothetical protein